MDPVILDDFYKKFGIKVKEIYYETDALKDKLLVATGGKGLDLMIGSGTSMRSYIQQGYISPLNPKLLKQLVHLNPRWYLLFPQLKKFAVPMLWGSLGIAYRTDKITSQITSWKQLFYPDAFLNQHILMIDDPRDLMGMALKSLGASVNSANPKKIKQAAKILNDQKPYVKSYGYITLGKKSELITGSIWMAMVYNGDGLVLSKLDPKIKYVVPKEGTNLWVDFIAVMNASKYKNEAMTFINYLNRPSVAAKLSRFTRYASANIGAKKFLSPRFIDNHAIYLSPQMIKNSEVYKPLSNDNFRLRNKLLDHLTANGYGR
jgi:spermidine/putrescine transport system substrate-binding protein